MDEEYEKGILCTLEEDKAVIKARSQVEHIQSRLEKCSTALAQKTKRLQEVEAKQRQIQKKRIREQRTRLLSHGGGMMEMVGLLNIRFFGTSERDNDQDDLRANLLVGALLDLSNRLAIASADELQRHTEVGRQYRQTNPKNRTVPVTNPLIILDELPRLSEE